MPKIVNNHKTCFLGNMRNERSIKAFSLDILVENSSAKCGRTQQKSNLGLQLYHHPYKLLPQILFFKWSLQPFSLFRIDRSEFQTIQRRSQSTEFVELYHPQAVFIPRCLQNLLILSNLDYNFQELSKYTSYVPEHSPLLNK